MRDPVPNKWYIVPEEGHSKLSSDLQMHSHKHTTPTPPTQSKPGSKHVFFPFGRHLVLAIYYSAVTMQPQTEYRWKRMLMFQYNFICRSRWQPRAGPQWEFADLVNLRKCWGSSFRRWPCVGMSPKFLSWLAFVISIWQEDYRERMPPSCPCTMSA